MELAKVKKNKSKTGYTAMELQQAVDDSIKQCQRLLKEIVVGPIAGKKQMMIVNDCIAQNNITKIFIQLAENKQMIDAILKAIEKLPSTKEFDLIKQELQDQKEKVRATLEPLRKKLEQTKEQEKRVSHIYV